MADLICSPDVGVVLVTRASFRCASSNCDGTFCGNDCGTYITSTTFPASLSKPSTIFATNLLFLFGTLELQLPRLSINVMVDYIHRATQHSGGSLWNEKGKPFRLDHTTLSECLKVRLRGWGGSRFSALLPRRAALTMSAAPSSIELGVYAPHQIARETRWV